MANATTTTEAKATRATAKRAKTPDATTDHAAALISLYTRGRDTDKAMVKATGAFRKGPTAERYAVIERLATAWIEIHDEVSALPAGTTGKGGITKGEVYGALFAPASKTELRKRIDAAFGV